MKPIVKRSAQVALAVLLVAQLFQPDRTMPAIDTANDLLVMTNAPDDIRQLVVGACYDCHSDRPTYPWYAYVTPVNFWLQDHINEGRETVNFSRWDQFAGDEEASEAGEKIAEGEMPLESYVWIHSEADFTDAQREQLVTWFDANTSGGAGHGAEGRDDEMGAGVD